ncbi:eukaryotic translation initiation factor 2-alpha kinase-like isoform X2 [Chelonus insularis]|uniref:eukaryotic translation initiation factor 2-alpha kinase-like isoform X2 n=1 Tax=Chelonus insularis TaxID=460826 RepID=UPI00158C5B91|nr:eukaryotic translation initiation factor 2-alpha kinase-like isoform X2 [Chelonus insularis]
MLRWQCMKQNIFKIILCIVTLSTVVSENTDNLSVGGTSANEESINSLVYVSTLDGRLSALDLNNSGEKKWTVDFDNSPLLSSNIHKKELNNDGHWVKLIPSLNGGLYKFDGESLEQIPITTEQLLRSSFRYSENLVFSGGKETRSYGISSSTGEILYQCDIDGCTNKTEGDTFLEQKDVLVVQRFQQTVRALEARTGIEKWNYSVGQHELILMPQEKNPCKNFDELNDIELKVIIPEGIIWAVNKKAPNKILWKYKFDSPIVSVWRENGIDYNNVNYNVNTLKELNLFDNAQSAWNSEHSKSPEIYIGMFDRQVYIQENSDSKESLELPSPYKTKIFPWQPYPANSNAVLSKESETNLLENNHDKVDFLQNNPEITALSVLYNSGYIDGNGYYLYKKEQLNSCNNTQDDTLNNNESKIHVLKHNESLEDSSMQIIIGSVWSWWKEILSILIATLMVNIFLTQHMLTSRKEIKDGFPEPIIVEKYSDQKESDDKQILNIDNSQDFKSQYLSDYEPIDCLGKGGFGVVFEAKKKIDDCHYAIKRIELPNNKNSRERVMREVKALAKLDHQNIVRYFHAWFECPPAGWQKEHDDRYINRQFSPAELTTNNYTTTRASNSVCIDVPSSDHCSIESAVEVQEFKINQNKQDSSSFIVFEASHSTNSTSTEETDDSDSPESDSSSNISASSKQKYMYDDDSESIVFEHSKKSHSTKSTDKKLIDKTEHKKCPKMFLYIQMQLCRRLSLRDWLKQQSENRNSEEIINIFKQIVDAVEYVHLQGLIHRDLKPSNILFAYDDKVKIGDFGLVTAIAEDSLNSDENNDEQNYDKNKKIKKHTANVGTHLYMSPEQINGVIYDYKVDIYSLGIILFELLVPFVTEMERVDALRNIKKSVFPKDFETKYSKEYNLLTMMLDENPERRPTTIGIKARPPLSNCQSDDDKWHFVMPQMSRHSSTTTIFIY